MFCAPRAFNGTPQNPCLAGPLRHPVGDIICRRYRNCLLRIGYASPPALAPDWTPGRISLPRNLGLQVAAAPSSCQAFTSLCAPLRSPLGFSAGKVLTTHYRLVRCFGTMLSLLNCRRMST